MPHTPDHIITTDYEALHLKAQAKRAKQIEQLYEKAIKEAANHATLVRYVEGTIFDITKSTLMAIINAISKKLQADIQTIIRNGINDSWDLSNAKNDAIFDRRIDRTKLPEHIVPKFYDANKAALEQFQKRATTNFAPSKRVWNIEKDFKRELEQTLSEGIANGKSAAKMSRDARDILNEPDKLFRRVRDAKGKLKLSKAAKEYNPGTGVYRSSYKNAIRLTGTETNMAYRKADNLRYKTAPGVIGFQVNLSNNHPKFDICDSLNLIYPVTFVFTGFHPHCRCYVTPVLCSDKEFERYIKAVESGTDKNFKFKGTVTEMPEGFNNYLIKNAERLNRLKSPPFFIRDNPSQTFELLK